MASTKASLIFNSKILMSISIKLPGADFFPELSLPTCNPEPWIPSGQENMLVYFDLKILFLDTPGQETTGLKGITPMGLSTLKPSLI